MGTALVVSVLASAVGPFMTGMGPKLLLNVWPAYPASCCGGVSAEV